MPKRMVDGDRIWTSDKLRSVEPEEWRFHYTNLLPLALANGSFECTPGRVLRDVYFYLRPSVCLEDVENILREYERVRLLFRWRDEHGKVWGFWVGITSEGLLPAKAHVDRGDYKKGKEPPADLLQKFIDGEIESGLLPTTPGPPPVLPLELTTLPPVGVGKGRLGKDRIGKEFVEFNSEGVDMKIKNEMQAVCAGFGVKPGGFNSTWSDVKDLGVGHSVGAVVRDFTEFLEENRGDDYPNGAVPVYLRTAHARLSDTTSSSFSAKDPEVVKLVRNLSYLSGGRVVFVDKQKIRLAEVLKEFNVNEITEAFRLWLDDQDLSDPKNVSFLAGKFSQIADQRSDTIRRMKQESEQTKLLRDSTARRLQEEAEAERANKPVEPDFDPLA